MSLTKWDDVPVKEEGGREVKAVSGQNGSVSMLTYVGPAIHDPHIHSNSEQFIQVIEGSVIVIMNDEEIVLDSSGIIIVPPKVEHSVKVETGKKARFISFFTPPFNS